MVERFKAPVLKIRIRTVFNPLETERECLVGEAGFFGMISALDAENRCTKQNGWVAEWFKAVVLKFNIADPLTV